MSIGPFHGPQVESMHTLVKGELPAVCSRPPNEIVSFEDAFSLDEWMGANEECTIPGG